MYRRNNINFRILSSDILQKFKKRQFLVFNELYNNEYDFSDTSKEILLLQYEQVFNFLLYVETLLLRSNTCDIESVKLQFEKINLITYSCINLNPDVFDKFMSEIWFSINTLDSDFINSCFTNFNKTNSIIDSFEFIGNLILEYVSNLLYTVHEIDYLIKEYAKYKTMEYYEVSPFLSFTNFAFIYDRFAENRSCYIYEKIQTYKKFFEDKFVIITLKIYSDNDKGYISTIDSLSKNGIIIDEII